MIDSVKSYAMSYEFISMLALFTYWVPMAVCLIVYIFRIISLYKTDLKECQRSLYIPELTIGLIVWWMGVSILPVFNLFAMAFDCASSVFKWLGKVLDIPLVRARPEVTK